MLTGFRRPPSQGCLRVEIPGAGCASVPLDYYQTDVSHPAQPLRLFLPQTDGSDGAGRCETAFFDNPEIGRAHASARCANDYRSGFANSSMATPIVAIMPPIGTMMMMAGCAPVKMI